VRERERVCVRERERERARERKRERERDRERQRERERERERERGKKREREVHQVQGSWSKRSGLKWAESWPACQCAKNHTVHRHITTQCTDKKIEPKMARK